MELIAEPDMYSPRELYRSNSTIQYNQKELIVHDANINV